MRNLILLALSIAPALSFAEPIITDVETIETLQSRVRKNQFYLKVGPARFKIFYFEVGKPQTPFYERGNQVKRFYKNDDKCFELTVFETMNIARKVGCYDKTQDLYLPGFEDYKAVTGKTLYDEGLKGFKANEFSKTYELQAFIQTIDTYSMDLGIYEANVEQSAPTRKFKTHLKGVSEVVLSKKEGLQLRQSYELSVDKIGILSARTTNTSNTIKVIPGGLIFSNGKGQVLIYNPAVRKPFGDYELSLNSQVPSLLESLAQQSQSAPVCFRDDYVSRGPKDCHRIIFESHSLVTFSKIQILAIDFVSQKIEFLK